ncbi:MAG: Rne/Rng family ribonuclease [Planctomycetes bacterium]|nr:Rne/Rng family ribonuclease [Planctomycetota bacterium]
MARKRRRRKPRIPSRIMLINSDHPSEIRVAILVEGILDELYIERSKTDRITGNIYKALVGNIDPALQAAFVDLGTGRNGFLHASDVVPPDGGYKGVLKKPRRSRRRKPQGRKLSVEEMLRSKQEVLVQVVREGLGHKGPGITTYISVPGKYLVLMPALGKVGVSKKIEDPAVRRKLKERMVGFRVPKELGLIVRTAASTASDDEIRTDLNYLKRVWANLKKQAKETPAPTLLYKESDLVTRALRETLTADTDLVVVDAQDAFALARDFVTKISPAAKDKVTLYEGKDPLFVHYRVERQIEDLYERRVSLPSGGYMVIDQTEAMVAVDVNTGHNKERSGAEEMILNTNLEAAHELARQLRLRDIGGLVLVDFIDMGVAENRKRLQDELKAIFSKDRARVSIAPISPFGVVEMTRQRTGKGILNVVFNRCPVCAGSGLVRSRESLGLSVMRSIRAVLSSRSETNNIVIVLAAADAIEFLNEFRQEISALEADGGPRIMVRPDPAVQAGRLKIIALKDTEELVTVEH